MTKSSLTRRGVLLAAIVLSALFLVAMVVLRVGVENTSYDTVDSLGRTMGFNDKLSGEHYRILIRNFRFSTLFKLEWIVSWCLLGMHVIGASMILSLRNYGARRVRWFFMAQPLFLFPFGWLGFLILPSVVLSIMKQTMDREGFIDIPFIQCTAGVIWMIVSIGIVCAMPEGPRGFDKSLF